MKRANSRRIAVILIAIMGLITIIYAVFSVPQKGLTVPINSADVNMDGIELYSATSNADESNCITLETKLSNYALDTQNESILVSKKESHIVSILKAKSGFEYEYQIIDYLPKAYEIELVTPNGNIFIEGSYNENSIFFNTNFDEYYYGGIGEYYGRSGEMWSNLINKTTSNIKPTSIMAFNFDVPQASANYDSASANSKSIVNSGFRVINNHNYFRTLIEFPHHVNINKIYPGKVGAGINPGTCGVVAVCMLLGYYQNNYDWNIIPQSAYRNGKGTNDAFAEYLFRNWIWDGKSIMASGTIMGAYDIVSKTNAGFPMAAVENKALITKYAKSNGQTYKHNASSWFPKTNVEKYIDKDVPSIGTTTAYSIDSEGVKEKSFHNVIIYGYSNGKYLCHMGWWPGQTDYTESVLSSLSLHSYYTISK